MSHLPQQAPTPAAAPAFDEAARGSCSKRRTLPPFSLRLNSDERARLERDAAGLPLGTYIKDRLFDKGARPYGRRVVAPVKDHAALAQVLGMLGAMRLANNLNQLAKAANIGTLPLTPEVEEELGKACAAVLAIKAELMRALGYPPHGDA